VEGKKQRKPGHDTQNKARTAVAISPAQRPTSGRAKSKFLSVHQPGQKLFVDWAGLKVPIHHAEGSLSEASLFVAVLGFSSDY